MIFHYTRARKTQIWPISSFLSYLFKQNCIFLSFSAFCHQDGFLTPWDPSQMKDLKIPHRIHLTRALFDRIWPCLCRFKVPNFNLFFIIFFVFEISCFFNLLKIVQLLSHVCMNMAIQTANVHWSPAGSILFFTSQGGWTTFVTRLQEYGHPACKCSLVPCEKHTFFLENSPLNIDVDLALCFPGFGASVP